MENPKHEIGDKVTIRDLSAYVGGISPEDVHIIEDMIPYFGKTAKIIRTHVAHDSRCYRLDCDMGAWTWTDWMFEPSNISIRKSTKRFKSRVRF